MISKRSNSEESNKKRNRDTSSRSRNNKENSKRKKHKNLTINKEQTFNNSDFDGKFYIISFLNS